MRHAGLSVRTGSSDNNRREAAYVPDNCTMRDRHPPPLISRRAFLVSATAAGGAITFGFPVDTPATALGSAPTKIELYNWVVIAPDNTVTIRLAQVEMGQGAMTAMAQLMAEELEVDWSALRTEFISIATHLRRGKVYGWARTVSSLGVRLSEQPLRTAGAQIRTMLVAAAAARLGVPAGELRAESSMVIHPPTGRKLSYAELAAEAAALEPPDPASVRLREPKDWRVIGRSVPRLDIPAKTDGSAIFGIDVRLPGMKHAAISMCPTFGGRVVSFDAEAALTQPGVRSVLAIEDGRAVVVVADEWWQAKAALDAMPITWDRGPWATLDSEAILVDMRGGLHMQPDTILRDDGDVERALAAGTRTLEAEYFVPYLEHATPEPINCTALVTNERFEVWAPTQVPVSAIHRAAEVAGMDVGAGELHVTLVGGGFGRRQMSDFVGQAVEIASAMRGTPVKLLWSREDTTRQGFYRPTSLSRLRAAIDAGGKVTAWWHRVVAHSNNPVQSTYGTDSLLYAVPNMRADLVVRESPVPLAPMRGVSFSMNCFATQSFVDELARAVGADTYAFQRSLLDADRVSDSVPGSVLVDLDGVSPKVRAARLRAVLDKAAQESGWGMPLEQGRGRGLAVNEEGSSFFAVVVEVTLDGEGWLKVDRVVVAGDCGYLVNPDAAAAQVEGSVAFALTSALYGEIGIRNGEVAQSNFHDYELLRLDEMPEVEVHWVLNGEVWSGVGEPAAAPVIPALTNAMHAAGGPRIRSLPIKNHRIARDAG